MQAGDKVWYLDEFKATVIGIRCNGVIIEFWGSGFQDGRLIRRRVPARCIKPRA